jgi:hypothetical protein
MRAIGQPMVFRAPTDDSGQAFADIPGRETTLLSARPAAKIVCAGGFADDGRFAEMLSRREPAMSFPFRCDHAALVPPLERPGLNTGQSNNIAGCESILHDSAKLLKTKAMQNI